MIPPLMMAPRGRRGTTQSLLHFDGTNGSTTFTDEKGLTWTANGAAQLSTGTKKFGTASLSLNGTNSYALSSTLAAFNPSSGDWTAEMWANFTDRAATRHLFQIGSGSGDRWLLFFPVTDTFQFLRVQSGHANVSATLTTPSTGVFHHIAVSRKGSDVRVFIDGVQAAELLALTFPSANSSVSIGTQQFSPIATDFLKGFVDEFRYTTGAAVYWTAPFTPPSVAFTG